MANFAGTMRKSDMNIYAVAVVRGDLSDEEKKKRPVFIEKMQDMAGQFLIIKTNRLYKDTKDPNLEFINATRYNWLPNWLLIPTDERLDMAAIKGEIPKELLLKNTQRLKELKVTEYEHN